MPHPVVTSLTEGEKPSPVQTITQIVQVHSRWERAETQACDPKLPIQAFICHISPYIIQKWKWIFHLRFLLFSFFLHCPKSRHSGPKLHFELIAKMINLKMGGRLTRKESPVFWRNYSYRTRAEFYLHKFSWWGILLRETHVHVNSQQPTPFVRAQQYCALNWVNSDYETLGRGKAFILASVPCFNKK